MKDVLDTLALFWPAFVASLVVALACALVGVHVVADEASIVGVLRGDRTEFGPPARVLAQESLSRIYGCPVESALVGGRHVIHAVPPVAADADGAAS